MSVKLFGLNEAKNALHAYVEAVNKDTANAIKLTALAIEADAIKSISRGTKTGRVYKRGKKTHTASAAGEAPSTDTGNLVSNIRAVIKPDIAYVGTDLDYGIHLEFGTRKIKERPWLRPASKKNESLFEKYLKAAVKQQ